MFLRAFFFFLAVISILSTVAPGSGGMASFSIVIVGWLVLNRLDELIEMAKFHHDAKVAEMKRARSQESKS